jgi:hypothetical protein
VGPFLSYRLLILRGVSQGAFIAPERECEAMTKPLIGLNADFRASKQDAPAFTYVASGYYDAT